MNNAKIPFFLIYFTNIFCSIFVFFAVALNLDTPSTPRNRLIADVLTKAGFVERSGQGVDKIFYQNLKEGKTFPFYSDSDLFHVTLKIPITVLYPAFTLFFNEIQKTLSVNERLSVHYIIVLAKIRDNIVLTETDDEIIVKLLEMKIIREYKAGYIFSQAYTVLIQQLEGNDTDKIIDYVKNAGSAKMADIVLLFNNRLTRRQVNNMVYNLIEKDIFIRKGTAKATIYFFNDYSNKMYRK